MKVSIFRTVPCVCRECLRTLGLFLYMGFAQCCHYCCAIAECSAQVYLSSTGVSIIQIKLKNLNIGTVDISYNDYCILECILHIWHIHLTVLAKHPLGCLLSEWPSIGIITCMWKVMSMLSSMLQLTGVFLTLCVMINLGDTGLLEACSPGQPNWNQNAGSVGCGFYPV